MKTDGIWPVKCYVHFRMIVLGYDRAIAKAQKHIDDMNAQKTAFMNQGGNHNTWRSKYIQGVKEYEELDAKE